MPHVAGRDKLSQTGAATSTTNEPGSENKAEPCEEEEEKRKNSLRSGADRVNTMCRHPTSSSC